MSTFQPKDRVVRGSEVHRGYIGAAGSILSHDVANDLYLVEWDKAFSYAKTSTITKEMASELKLLTVAQAEQNKLDSEFAILEAQCKEKLAAAAALINEASALASKHRESLHEMYEATSPLMRSLDDAGWSTSSMEC